MNRDTGDGILFLMVIDDLINPLRFFWLSFFFFPLCETCNTWTLERILKLNQQQQQQQQPTVLDDSWHLYDTS